MPDLYLTCGLTSRANYSQCPALFRDSFRIDTTSGVITPSAAAGYELRLRSLAGFAVQPELYQFSVDVRKGEASGNINLLFKTPDSQAIKVASFKLNATGNVEGNILVTGDQTPRLALKLGIATLIVKEAALNDSGLTVHESALVLPTSLGGAKATLPKGVIRITGDRQIIPAGIPFHFPNMHVGGSTGFGIEDARATIRVENGTVLFDGSGAFMLPGLSRSGNTDDKCKLGTSFELANTSPLIREAELSIEGCAKIPIGPTGFFLNKVKGKVSLDEYTTSIDLEVGIESLLKVPTLGPAFSGEPSAQWDTSWSAGLKGKAKFFTMDLADVALKLSHARGLEGTVRVGQGIQLQGGMHAWYDNSFHITGRVAGEARIDAGSIFEKCNSIGVTDVCLSIPPTSIQGGKAEADFGEFLTPNGRTYGIKGRVDSGDYAAAFFLSANGDTVFERNGLTEYQLAGLAQVQSAHHVQSTDVRAFIVAPNTPSLLVGLATASGAPTLSLISPNGQTLTATSPGVVATTTTTQTLLAVADPAPGQWQVSVSNVNGGDQYIVAAFGTRLATTIAAPTVTANGDGSYTIGLAARSTSPTSTISLFDDTSPISRTGEPIVESLSLTTTTYLWRPTAATNGTHYVYAMVDDPFGAPMFAYSATPITINDTTPPNVPTGVRVRGGSTAARIMWDASPDADVAGYRISYQEPNGGTMFVADVPSGDLTSYTQGGLYLNGDWSISLSAYDINGNESAKSTAVSAVINDNGLYLPLVAR